MLAFTIRRLVEAALVMLTVAMLAFVLFRFVGDPVNQMVGQDTSLADREALRERLGLNDPIPIQLGRFIWNAASYDFGISYQVKRPVTSLIAERFPATFELALAAALFAILLGIPMGVYTGIHRDSWLSKLFLSVSLVGISLPPFLIGILLIYVFAVHLGVLPSFGRGEVVAIGGWTTGLLTASGLKALILPAITLGLFQMTLVTRLVRSQMLEVLRTDYIKFARARGLSERAVNFGHALKNTLIPVITIIGLQLGAVIAFAIITETVFQWPGMGLMFIQAIQNADIPVMAAYLILVAFLFVAINLVVDLLYVWIDPRVRIYGREAMTIEDQGLTATEAPPTAAVPARAAPRLGFLARMRDTDLYFSFRSSHLVMLAAAVTLLIIGASLLAPIIAPHDPYDLRALNLMDSDLPPAWVTGGDRRFLLGTDDQGRDILSTILYGTRSSIAISLLAVLLAIAIGVSAGLVAGYYGGIADTIIMRIADVKLTFPPILVALLINGIAQTLFKGRLGGSEFWILVLSIGLSFWVQYARTVRGMTLVEKNKEYVQAARLIGLGKTAIMFKHVLPNVLSPVLVIGTINLALAVITEATLSFLGVGLPPTEPSLGTMIQIGNKYLFSGSWWMVAFPGLTLAILVLAVNLLGDWLRDALNPKLR